MKIGKVTSWLLRVPYQLPLMTQEHHTVCNFIEIETDDGIKGNALSTYPMKNGIHEYINKDAAIIVGMDPMHPEEIRARLILSTAGKQTHGAWACAASLIDIALWDIKGKALKKPIWELLGGARNEVPAYVTFGFSRFKKDELVEIAKMLVKDGHLGLKMVVGNGPHIYDEARRPTTDASIAEDVARVQAVREAIGPNIDLMMDANKNPSMTHALKLAKLCEPYNLTWFEDAVPQGDPRLMSTLRKKTMVPLAAGSTGTSDLMYLREYLLHESVDYLQPNVRDIGGFTQGLKAAGMAQAFNIPLGMGGQFPHLNMHLHAAVPNGGRIEFHFQSWKLFEATFDGAPQPVNGKVTLPTAPGLGFLPKSNILDLKTS